MREKKRIGIGPVRSEKRGKGRLDLVFHWKIANFYFEGKRFYRVSSQKTRLPGISMVPFDAGGKNASE